MNTIIAAGFPREKLFATLFAIVLVCVIARALSTGSILTNGVPSRVYRGERPLAYWYYVISYAFLATLALLAVFFHIPFWIFCICFGVLVVAFYAAMSADRRMTGRPTYAGYWRSGPLWTRVLLVPAAFLTTFGLIGFVATLLAAAGALNWLPGTIEFPVGRADGVITMPGGDHIVPLYGSSQIQVYDPGWHFVRGWFLGSAGQKLHLRPSGQNRFDVFTSRLHAPGNVGNHWIFTLEGDLISNGRYSLDDSSYNGIVNGGATVFRRAPFWLWVFSSPGHWAASLVAGMLLLIPIQFRLIVGGNSTAVRSHGVKVRASRSWSEGP